MLRGVDKEGEDSAEDVKLAITEWIRRVKSSQAAIKASENGRSLVELDSLLGKVYLASGLLKVPMIHESASEGTRSLEEM